MKLLAFFFAKEHKLPGYYSVMEFLKCIISLFQQDVPNK